ncbi:hypothetical protein SAMN05421638_1300 [Kaistella treverensis]|uniref:Uncharacterized protein n=1 Tax=Kaistella treverensis TaxID=631455 RepID=A0A1I3LSL6_9FLAO|nr:DUF5687 family protein [Kaistella treverensis]SFI87505.1 hypothetical protein SAMN05421638_1300 [Kaistella treverensis]
MYGKLLKLELQSFFRNPQFGANLAMKILMGFTYMWLGISLVAMAFGLYFYSREELNIDPVRIFSKYFLYYAVADLVIRYFMQQMPTQNIKPFLSQNISKKTLVNYTILKIFFNFFNWGYLLFMLPFCGLLIFHGGFSVVKVLMFLTGIMFVFYFNNFLNILLNKKNAVLYAVGAIVAAIGVAEYYGYIKLSEYSEQIFYSFYQIPGMFLIPVLLTGLTAYLAYRNILANFYLDRGLEMEKEVGKTENIEFLNRFGTTGTFINNDIRLLKRSKAAKSALFAGIMFLFYGLLYFSGKAYSTDFMRIFLGIFVTGGFLFMFGQRVPAWDSSYYQLMMTQNVPYKDYLKAKWSVVVLATIISMVLAVFYVFISWEFYLTIFAAGLYNLGVNSYLTLLAGAYNKKPIDLNSRAKSFGGGANNMNMKVVLIMVPQMVLPMAVFAAVKYFFGLEMAVASLAVLGLTGFLLRDKIFDLIVKTYKSQKYSTISAFKKI